MRILVIDDDLAVARSIQRTLHDHEVWIETDSVRGMAHAARAEMEGVPFGLVLCNFTMPGMSGFDVLVALRSHLEPPACILMSDYEHVVDAALIADAVVIKPFHSDEVRDTIAHVKAARSRAATRRIQPRYA